MSAPLHVSDPGTHWTVADPRELALNMMSMAGALARCGYLPFVHTFGVFATRRPYDQIANAIAYPNLPVRIIGFMPGVSTTGGPSHQATDDVALMRALPNMTVVDVADAVETRQVPALVADVPADGIHNAFQELLGVKRAAYALLTGEAITAQQALEWGMVNEVVPRERLISRVTDADCTDSTDLAGIYFAVQASYEQQIVNANQQALSTAVQQYRAAYAKEVNKLPGLLKTASAQPFPGAPAGRPTSANG